MNPSAIALILLVACANAQLDGELRDDSQTFDFVTFINDAVNKIKDMDADELDPYRNIGEFYQISLNYPWLGELEIAGYFQNILLYGLRDVIYDVNYEEDMFVIDLRFPRLESDIGVSAWQVSYQGSPYEIQFGGRFAVNDLVIIVRVKQGSTEPSDEDYQFEVRIGSIESKMTMIFGGNNISEKFNDFMETSMPSLLRSYQKEPNNIISKLMLKLPEILKMSK